MKTEGIRWFCKLDSLKQKNNNNKTKKPHQSQMVSSIHKNREFKSGLKMTRSSNSEKDVSSIPLELS